MLRAHDLDAGPNEDPDLDIEAVAAAAMRSAIEKTRGDGLNLDPERVERDLTRLVLALIEFVRQLLEAQAIRRMEAGRLTPEQEERLGDTLMRARERLLEIAAKFDLAEEDLRLDLGPLGRLS